MREEYLLTLLFGSLSKPALELCVKRAYRDLSRTIHGIAAHHSKAKIHNESPRLIGAGIRRVLDTHDVESQRSFDDWHRGLTKSLSELYRANGFGEFTVGQAQKWINMTWKYAVTLGEVRVRGIDRVTQWLHVPIDSVILAQLQHSGSPGIEVPWSRLRDYDEYLALQKWIRSTFSNETPMEVEFRLWRQGMRERDDIVG